MKKFVWRKSATGQGEDYSTRCLVDCDYIKNQYRLIAVDLSRQKELDADPKAIWQIEFFGLVKKIDANYANYNPIDSGNYQSMVTLIILEKIKETWLKISQGIVTVL